MKNSLLRRVHMFSFVVHSCACIHGEPNDLYGCSTVSRRRAKSAGTSSTVLYQYCSPLCHVCLVSALMLVQYLDVACDCRSDAWT